MRHWMVDGRLCPPANQPRPDPRRQDADPCSVPSADCWSPPRLPGEGGADGPGENFFQRHRRAAPRRCAGSGGYTLALYRPSQAWSTLTPGTAVGTVIVRAKAIRCDGSPRAAISIDGSLVRTAKVSSLLYKNYSMDVQMAPGAHNISIAFVNDFAGAGCDRSLYIDKVTLSDAYASPGPSSVTLRQVDGGAGYYGQFSNALPTADTYFPIAVWGSYNHTTQNRDLDAAAGINTYVWAADNTFVDDIRADGRFKVIQDEGNRASIGSETAGWLLADEIDMTEGPGACPSRLDSIKSGLLADGGCGTRTTARAWRSGRPTRRRSVSSTRRRRLDDMYWHTDPNERGRPQSGTSSGYGWTVDRMRALDAMDGSVSRSGTSWKSGGRRSEDQNGSAVITPAEVRARGVALDHRRCSRHPVLPALVQRALRGRSSPTRSNCAGHAPDGHQRRRADRAASRRC